jgi:hypothetical protein
MRTLVGIASVAALVAVVAAPIAAQAAKASDKLVVYNAKGNIVARQVVTEDSGETVGFHKINIVFNPAEFGDFTALLDPNGTISDIVGLHTTLAGGLAFGFKSDTETESPRLFGWGSGGVFVPEAGWVDVTKYLDTGPTSGQQGWTARFWSDVDTVAVPEPASWILMIGGLAAVGAGLRSSRKNAAATSQAL